ncbi:hypothetical protein HK099_006751 [Clydaea vesicula]|uniref:HSF-type DNA-binding domain-containing protein n=1 Tax=Clydaea vesicula TaxID=447962 RepID=A0AAD5U624_9FUNG|nr:hypothetical protein HK099_006751 [Clydaea vesicula]
MQEKVLSIPIESPTTKTQLHQSQQLTPTKALAAFNNFSNSPSQSPLMSPHQSPQSPVVGKNGCLFVHKLYNMIFDQNYQNLIFWNSHGTSFTVNNVVKFSKEVLPKHFKHNNFSSFVRQLNMYSFLKTNKSNRSRSILENQVWEFSHPKFLRDQPELLDDIKSTKARKSLELDKNSSQSSNQVIVQLQSQLAQVLMSVQSMQEQFTEVVRELNDVKRKGAIHQVMMRNVLLFMQEKRNLHQQGKEMEKCGVNIQNFKQIVEIPEFEAAIQDPSFAPMDQELTSSNKANDSNFNLDGTDFGFQMFDDLLPTESKGDTMPQPLIPQQQQNQVQLPQAVQQNNILTSSFTPPSSQIFKSELNSQQLHQQPLHFNSVQSTQNNQTQSSAFNAPMQSPYQHASQSPYQPSTLQNSYQQQPSLPPYQAPSQSQYNQSNPLLYNNNALSNRHLISQQPLVANMLTSKNVY